MLNNLYTIHNLYLKCSGKPLKLFILSILLFAGLLSFTESFAQYSPWEASFTYGRGTWAKGRDSTGVTDYRVSLAYYPESFQWHLVYLGFDANFSRLLSTKKNIDNTSINILAIAPTFRWYYYQGEMFSPFLEASAGPGIMTSKSFDGRALGTRFTFQDLLGFGVKINTTYPIVTAIRLMHYSNANLAKRNMGITVPINGYIAIRF